MRIWTYAQEICAISINDNQDQRLTSDVWLILNQHLTVSIQKKYTDTEQNSSTKRRYQYRF